MLLYWDIKIRMSVVANPQNDVLTIVNHIILYDIIQYTMLHLYYVLYLVGCHKRTGAELSNTKWFSRK